MTIAPVPRTTVPFWDRLDAFGDAAALVTATGTVTYAELAARVRDVAHALESTRRLVALETRNDVDTVVGLLACLAGRHPVLPVDPDRRSAELLATYDPDVVLGARLTERRPGTAHDLHPDLALLLSTSGSTGSPKLVRLSVENLTSNAVAIGSYLGIRSTDLAATTLPLHYCYGLSVLTSHLTAGAAVLLTDLSVVDPCFWELVRHESVTTFPGVPHTFDLLDRVGFDGMELPSLRYLTVAGGRLAPAAVRRYAALGQQRGFDLFVMYGATEATARMAYLPPDLAADHPSTIGVPIPGGSFDIEDGELCYRGANVMMGYASSPLDLGRGRDVDVLRTGDLARRTPEGLVEITGRAARIAKVFGLRVDLGRVERALLDAGVVGFAADGGDRVVVAVVRSAGPVSPPAVVAASGLPAAAIQVVLADEVPRLASGKPDYPGVVALVSRETTSTKGGSTQHEGRLNGVFAGVLGLEPTDVRDDDSFVTLGGDSLSYVEMSLRLEQALGHLPAGWHLMTVAELSAKKGERRRGRTVETNVVLRALAIVMIVGSHSNLFTLLGGAHLLVGLAGFNFGRFQVTDRPRLERVRSMLTSLPRIVVPSVLWLTFAAATSAKYGWENVLLLNGVLGTRAWSEAWHYWFIEALVWTLVGLAALLAVPRVDRVERRFPFWLPLGLALVALLTRYDVVELFSGDEIHRANVIFWLFALGWAAVKAPTWKHRLLVSGVLAATVPGFFTGPMALREATVVAGLLLLVWLPSVRVPAPVARICGVLAGASLYIYLVHWQVYPAYEFSLPWLATTLSLTAGIVFWWVVGRISPWVSRTVAGVTLRASGEIHHDRGRLSLRRCPERDHSTTPLGEPAR
ncbi:MAG TPA: AMP-binding protein [Marmoricola sp.]|nr:AMP-binding protein [Marmoricola sp.]